MTSQLVLRAVLLFSLVKMAAAANSLEQNVTIPIAALSLVDATIRVQMVLEPNWTLDGDALELVRAEYFNGVKMTISTMGEFDDYLSSGQSIYCSAVAHNPEGAANLHINEELKVVGFLEDNKKLRVRLPSATKEVFLISCYSYAHERSSYDLIRATPEVIQQAFGSAITFLDPQLSD